MKTTLLGIVAAIALAAGCIAGGAQAGPLSGAALLDTPTQSGIVDDVAVTVRFYGGHRFCFYFHGWHGPGWYRCGWSWRRGYGWGGVYGWNDWYYGPARRRFGHGGFRGGERYGRGREHFHRQGRLEGSRMSGHHERSRDGAMNHGVRGQGAQTGMSPHGAQRLNGLNSGGREGAGKGADTSGQGGIGGGSRGPGNQAPTSGMGSGGGGARGGGGTPGGGGSGVGGGHGLGARDH